MNSCPWFASSSSAKQRSGDRNENNRGSIMNMNFQSENATLKRGKKPLRFGLSLVAMAFATFPLGEPANGQGFSSETAGVRNAGAPTQGSRRSIQHDGRSFTVVPASEASVLNFGEALETASSPSASGSAASNSIDLIGFQSRLLGCDDDGCGDGSGHGSCGSGGCGNAYGGSSAMAGFGSGAGFGNGSGGGLACPTCDPYCYVRAEALYMRRNGLDNFTRSRNFRLGDHDFEIGPRITIGQVPDCVNGTEFTFTGPLEWTNTSTV